MKKVDERQILSGGINDIEGWSVPLLISWDEAVALIQAYDPANQYSSDAGTEAKIQNAWSAVNTIAGGSLQIASDDVSNYCICGVRD